MPYHYLKEAKLFLIMMKISDKFCNQSINIQIIKFIVKYF